MRGTILSMLVATPTAAVADTPHGGSGGAGVGSGGGGGGTMTAPFTTTTPSSAAPAPDVIRLGGVLNASGDGITLTVAAAGTQGRPLTITGAAPSGDAGAVIDIESVRSGRSNWALVATATIAQGGGFTAEWTPSSTGQMAVRAVIAPRSAGGAGGATGLSRAGGSVAAAGHELSTSPLTIPIFKNAIATIYGPGFWGHRTACGERLTHAMLGVASRTLKCGTQVAVLYRGREITVPVIDRGPFGSRARWDLTMATARALGIRETVTVGTLASRVAPAFNSGR